MPAVGALSNKKGLKGKTEISKRTHRSKDNAVLRIVSHATLSTRSLNPPKYSHYSGFRPQNGNFREVLTV